MLIRARRNALEIDGRTARRYVVVTYELARAVVTDAVLTPEPIEELALPLSRDEALELVGQHFYDLPAHEQTALVGRRRRPTGPL